MLTSDFDYELPPHLIAQTPLARGESRLMIVDRKAGTIRHSAMTEFPDLLRPGDCLVLNDTRVSARKAIGFRASGRPLDILLMHPHGETSWRMLAQPARSLRSGTEISIEVDPLLIGRVTEVLADGSRIVDFGSPEEQVRAGGIGVAPLPPYITETLEDESRYQTVYANDLGSAAAPTAGLHFTEAMLDDIARRGVSIAPVTLHVGIDTFRPVREERLEDHEMHGEGYRLSPGSAGIINGSIRTVCVGTTTVRALESAASEAHYVEAGEGTTRLFISPGYEFRVTEAMLTNFHLPRSTLLALVSAFAGQELVMEAYREAVREGYRFYSFGDAMFIE